jgi:hypothetical protein
LALYWLYIGSILALYWLYTGSILALYWLYIGSILALYWLYTGSILALYWLYIGSITEIIILMKLKIIVFNSYGVTSTQITTFVSLYFCNNNITLKMAAAAAAET